MSTILMPEVIQGVHAGALDAIAVARRTGTNLVIWRDGHIVEITPDEADLMVQERKKESNP